MRDTGWSESIVSGQCRFSIVDTAELVASCKFQIIAWPASVFIRIVEPCDLLKRHCNSGWHQWPPPKVFSEMCRPQKPRAVACD